LSSTLELKAPAKLNLFLEVLGRRPDGYHDIDSVFCAIDLYDTVRLERADEISLTVEGLPAPTDETNLAWRAAAALGVGAKISLTKRIPAGAGLGGGSSDAAAVLVGLDRLYGLKADLATLAVGLGADVSFFLSAGTARCTGIGDLVEPVTGAPKTSFLLVTPALTVSTAEVYGALDPLLTPNRETATVFLGNYLAGARRGPAPYFNRLQAVAERLRPELRAVREAAEEQFGTSFTLTGSGSAYFAEIVGALAVEAGGWAPGGVGARVNMVKAI